MRIHEIAGALAIGALFPAMTLAQHTTGPHGTSAGIAPAPASAAPAQGRHHGPPHAGQYRYGNLPIVVYPDGRVFADFGRGYEQLVRVCGAAYNNVPTQSQPQAQGPVQPQVVQPLPGVNQPTPYTPPVPSQATASQQMANQAAASYPVNNQACYLTDVRGQVLVGR